MKCASVYGLRSAIFLASLVAIGGLSRAADPKEKAKDKTIVGKVLKIEYVEEEINPPNLVVTATGEVPTGGYTKVELSRVVYVTPPADGIQDYFLTAVPPTGIVIQVITEVKAGNTWKGYLKEAPWIKGIRVHGIGDGTKVVMLGGNKPPKASASREFLGVSKKGSPSEALEDALAKLNKALSEGNVADAQAKWELIRVSGTVGGITGSNDVEVRISATRTPPW